MANPSASNEIYIDWPTKVINIPQDAPEMTIVQVSPIEIYNLDLNQFRLKLKEIEAGEGMPFLDTHSHNTEVIVGGLSLARVIEIINGYTVTFEDGQYAVNLVGANSNVGDVVNVNQVSVRSQNSAGLISSAAIEYSSFGGGVHIDVINGGTGTIYNNGTPENPVNNFTDALLIADFRGFDTFFIVGNVTVPSGINIEGFTLIGQSPIKSTITVDTGAETLGCEFRDATVAGVLDGNSSIRDCNIGDLDYVYGTIRECVLDPGTITLNGSQPASFFNCWSGSPGGTFPIINMGGSGQSLSIQNYNGRIEVENHAGTDALEISINAGEVILDSTITAGNIIISGVGILIDNSTGTTTVNTDGLMSKQTITEISWDEVWLDTSVVPDNPSNRDIAFPKGTRSDPVCCLVDALAVAANQGITQINIITLDQIVADSDHNLDGLTFVGKNNDAGMILDGCSTINSSFDNLGLTGTCNGRTNMKGCAIAPAPFTTLNDFHGQMERCFLLNPMSVLEDIFGITITDCFSYSAFKLDMNNQDVVVDFRNQAGNTIIKNLTTDTNMSISFDAGTLVVENSCTAGTITVEGVARVTDSSIGTCEVIQISTVSKAHTDLISQQLEIQRKHHIGLGETYYWNPYDGDDTLDGKSKETAVQTFQRAHNLVESGAGDHIICLATDPSGFTHAHENIEISKDDVMIRSVGREFTIHPHDYDEPTVKFTGEGCQLQSMQIEGAEFGAQSNIEIRADHVSIDTVWINNARLHGVYLTNTKYSEIKDCVIEHSGRYFDDLNITNPSAVTNPSADVANPSDISDDADGIFFGYNTKENTAMGCTVWDTNGDGIFLDNEGGYCTANYIKDCRIFGNEEYGINISVATSGTILDTGSTVQDNALGDINDNGEKTYYSGIDNFTLYNDVVVLDSTNGGLSGTQYPRGTGSVPSTNITDAIAIARKNGLRTIRTYETITLTAAHDVSGLEITGVGSSIFVICAGADTTATRFDRCFVTGVFNGVPTGNLCGLVNIAEVDGVWVSCGLAGTVTIASGAELILQQCISVVPGSGTPILDCNAGEPGNVNMRGYAGGVEIRNFDEATQRMTIDMLSCNAKIHTSCTAGQIVLRGTGMYTDDSGPNCEVVTEGLTYQRIYADAIWDKEANPSAVIPGSFGDALLNIDATATVDAAAIADAVWAEILETNVTAKEAMRILTAVAVGKTTITGNTVVFRDVNDNTDRVTATMSGSERITITLIL